MSALSTLDSAPDLAVRIALRDRALRTLSELMAAEHTVSDRRQAAIAALRYLAHFENPRGPKRPHPEPDPGRDPDPGNRPSSSSPPAAASSTPTDTRPASTIRFDPLPHHGHPAAPRASKFAAAVSILSNTSAGPPRQQAVQHTGHSPDQPLEFPRRGDTNPLNINQPRGSARAPPIGAQGGHDVQPASGECGV